MWILGEYATSKEDIEAVMSRIRAALGELPLLEAENKRQAGEKSLEDGSAQVTPAQLVTSDGTYATQSAFSATSSRNYFRLIARITCQFQTECVAVRSSRFSNL